MAVVSQFHQYLFIQVPRTGCTALGVKLVRDHRGEWLPKENIVNPRGRVIGAKHIHLGALRKANLVDDDDIKRLTIFAATRNPFDSIVSLYAKLTGKYLPLLDEPDSFIHRQPAMLEDVRFLKEHSFSEWVIHKYRNVEPGRLFYWRWLTPNIDHVLKFEQLQEDFNSLAEIIGLEGDTTIETLNETTNRDRNWRPYYNQEARQTVERVFAADFDRFGYSF